MKPKITQSETEPVAPEIMARSIEEIAKAMKTLSATRLKRDAVIILIHARSKVGKREIELVLNNLEELEQIWLKPKKQQ
jgi:hypothetical protein